MKTPVNPEFETIRSRMRATCGEKYLKQLIDETDIVEFAKGCGFFPEPYQAEAMLSKAKWKIYLWARQCGKTATCAIEALHEAMFFKEHNVVVVSKSQRQARLLMRDARRWLKNYKYAHPNSKFTQVSRESADEIEFAWSGSSIWCVPATASVRGFTATKIVVDEAAQVPDQCINEEIKPLLLTTGGSIIMISTPHARGTAFHEAYMKAKMNGNVWKLFGPVKSEDFSKANKDHLAREREVMPEDYYRQEYEAEWIEGLSNVFSLDDIDGCMMGPEELLPSYDATVVGVDLAKINDWSVFVALTDPGGYVIGLEEMQRIPYPQVASRLKTFADRHKARKILVDKTGVGDAVMDIIQQSGIKQTVDAIALAQLNKENIINSLRAALEKRLVHIPWKDSKIIARKMYAQLVSYRYEEVSEITHSIRTTAPSGKHDDIVIALALAAYQIRPHGRIQFIKALSNY